MKEDWKYSKLGDICDLYQPKTISADMLVEDGEYLVYGANGIIGRYDKYNHEESEVLLTCRGATCGSINISEPYSWINGNAMVVHPSNEKELRKDFIRYYLASVDWSKVITGAAQPQITRQSLSPLQVACPPLPEQESIVAELDCLSGVIEKQKQQLKELDNLAQAIFFDMFGDPITNEKGWEVKRLEDVSTLLNGRAYKQHELLNEGKYKVLRVGNFFTNDNYYYSDLELEDSKYCDNGDLLFAWSASFGAFIWNGGKVIYHYHIWKVLYDVKVLNIEYYKYLLNAMTTYFMKDVHGIGMVHLTKCGMEQYILPLPPLSLQQEFASKIEAIEKQKELIKQSLSETETLFNSRMDYYFN